MFTGIVEELGEIIAFEQASDSARLTLRGPRVTADAAHGDSIAVNGVCLTVTDGSAAGAGTFVADVMAETLHRSTLGHLRPGSPVNLERAVRADGRLGGHIVNGHVDGVAEVVSRVPSEHWETVTFSLPEGLGRYVVEKGSVAVDGVSLTVTAVDGDTFSVGLIPTTLAATTLGRAGVGDHVNIEVDVLAKYVERMLAGTR